jgi:predicted ATP-grasp superfamily ATP-dependent carboligase
VDLLILGASARAAAQSALRAGLRPLAVDLFADRDLAALAPVHRIAPASYPQGLDAIAAELPPGPWMYTGALENQPDLIDRLARVRPLWGNAGSTLRAVRDPSAVADVLGRAGLACPAVRMDPRGLPRDGGWLVKPLASAGGRHIHALTLKSASPARPSFYQERIDGPSLAALFLGQGASAILLGVTRQWIGRPGLPFTYRGSLGPWPISPPLAGRLERLGNALTSAFGLVGLFGVDFILRDDHPWPVEVNPRYTASVEVLELGLQTTFLDDHRRACDPNAAVALTPGPAPSMGATLSVGKAIVFAEEPCTFPELTLPMPGLGDGFTVPSLADIPHSGTAFEAGEPVLTLFAQGKNLDDCQSRLERSLTAWQKTLSCNHA